MFVCVSLRASVCSLYTRVFVCAHGCGIIRKQGQNVPIFIVPLNSAHSSVDENNGMEGKALLLLLPGSDIYPVYVSYEKAPVFFHR